jgi:Fe-S cluster biogenesis protein NfuA
VTADDPVEHLRAALDASVLPLVIARGGSFRLVAIDGTEAVLEVSGSPGSVLPLVGRIEHVVRAAHPALTGVRLVGPDSEATEPAAVVADLEGRVRSTVERSVNPVVAAHRGHVTVLGVDGGWVRIQLEGGCQGCSLAEVTLRQGIEPLLRQLGPGLVGVIDVTDHAAGTDPYFSPEKR